MESRKNKPLRLDQLTRLIEKSLARLLAAPVAAPRQIHQAMRYCVLSGGKRFRPLLCLGACEAVGAPARSALSVACALELIHTYSLVHDDLPAMDNAESRRGRPTCHRRFDEATAILAGDALLTLSFEILSRNGTPNTLPIIRKIGRFCGTTGLIGGQVMDLQVIRQPDVQTPHSLKKVARLKTAALITASVVAGGLAGRGSVAQLKRLELHGQKIGLAFQLIDDLHDQDGLVRVTGVKAIEKEARSLIRQALSALEPFGRAAIALRELSGWLEATLPSIHPRAHAVSA